MLLLILFAFIAALLAAQIILSASPEQATNGTIVEEAGAITAQAAPGPGTGFAIPENPAGGAAAAGLSSGPSTFTTLDIESPNQDSGGAGSSEPGPDTPAAPGSLSGRVVSGAAPAGSPLARITVYLADSTGAFTGPSARTAADGSFGFPGLAPGDYRLFFFDPAGAWKSAWYGGAPPAGLVVHVAAGGAVSVSQALLPAEPSEGSIAGRVTDGSGKGVGGVSVLAYLVDEGAGIKLLFQSEVVTDDNGDYRITGLPPASSGTGGTAAGYKIQFMPSKGGYASQWFSEQPTYQTAKLIELHAGETADGIDARLGGGGTISGTVTIEAGNKPAASVLVDIFDEAGVILDTQLTAADGSYKSDALPAGAYGIRVTSRSSQYESEWYNNRKDFASADKVMVVSGSDSGGIDINLDPPPPPEPPEPPVLHSAAASPVSVDSPEPGSSTSGSSGTGASAPDMPVAEAPDLPGASAHATSAPGTLPESAKPGASPESATVRALPGSVPEAASTGTGWLSHQHQ